MTKIGIISDTHHHPNIALEAIKILKDNGADIILHAGDIVEARTLFDLKDSKLPYVAVLGNNDYHLERFKNEFNLFTEPHTFEFQDIKIKIMHHPKFLTPDADMIVFGHTHSFTAFLNEGKLFINPGEICGRKFINFSFAMVVCDKKEFRVFKFSKAPNEPNFHQSEVQI